MNDVERKKEREWRDMRKKFFAHECKRREHELVPSAKNPRNPSITWAQLFRERYKQNLNEYLQEGTL